MTKAAKNGSNKVISLKDFHETVPGLVSAENHIPLKPARRDVPNNQEIDNCEQQPCLEPNPTQTSLRPGGGTNPWASPKQTAPRPVLQTAKQPALLAGEDPYGLAPGAAGYGNSFPNSSGYEESCWKENPPSASLLDPHPHSGVKPGFYPGQQQKQWGPSSPQPQKVAAQAAGPASARNMLCMSVPKRAQVQKKAQTAAGDNQFTTPGSGVAPAGKLTKPSGEINSSIPAVAVSATAGGRPVLNIKPRTRPVHKEPSSLPIKDVRNADDGPRKERPKLNLKPRSEAVEPSSPDSLPQRSASVFGEAVPREVVLSNRGVPVPSGHLDRTGSAPALGKPRAEGWHRVQSRRKTGMSFQSAPPRGSARSTQVDPFFSDYIPTHKSFSAFVGDAEAYEIPAADRRRSDDSSAFLYKRSLPIRADDDILF